MAIIGSMHLFKRQKLILLPLLLLIMSCVPTGHSDDSFLSSGNTTLITEDTSISFSEIESESSNEPLESESSSAQNNSTESSATESIPSSVPESSEVPSSSEASSEVPISSEANSSETPSSSEEVREPGIYLARTRIGVAITKTVTIEHEVYPSHLGSVTWTLIPDPDYGENQPASVTPEGEVTGLGFSGTDEFLIKGTLLEFEVYVTLMIFFDYDKKVDTFYPSSELYQAIGYGNRYHNGTTVYARSSRAYPIHYYAYNLKAGMTFNIMALTRYSYDRPKFYFEFGKVVNNEFVVLTGPFISNDGKALLLGYDVLEDGEYIVRMKPHIDINTSSDEFSYIKYTFWF